MKKYIFILLSIAVMFLVACEGSSVEVSDESTVTILFHTTSLDSGPEAAFTGRIIVDETTSCIAAVSEINNPAEEIIGLILPAGTKIDEQHTKITGRLGSITLGDTVSLGGGYYEKDFFAKEKTCRYDTYFSVHWLS